MHTVSLHFPELFGELFYNPICQHTGKNENMVGTPLDRLPFHIDLNVNLITGCKKVK